MRVWHVENPIHYRRIHYPRLWDPILLYDPIASPLSHMLKALRETPPAYVRWMEDVKPKGLTQAKSTVLA